MTAQKEDVERKRLRELVSRYCETRDIKLRNEIIGGYLYIAEIVARRFSGRGVEYDDLYQVASLALIKALERFDCGKGVEFASFATPSTVGEVKNYFRDKLRIIRLPRRASETMRELENVRERLMQTLQHNPTPAEIALEMNVPLDEVMEALESRNAAGTLSLDSTPESDDDTGSLGDILGGEDPSFEKVELNDYLRRELDKLDGLERRVIMERFFNERSQRDVAQELHVSQMYISRLERRVLARLRAAYGS